MDSDRLDGILAALPKTTVAVLGDFFLDKYLEIDPALAEKSIETGLPAHQVVNIRTYPGAAGTVLNNLVALGVGRIVPIGFTGLDGEGFELRAGLSQRGVDLTHLVETTERHTPTYTKPLVVEDGKAPRELERFDIKNRQPTPKTLESEFINRLRHQLDACDAVVVADQIEEENCGVVTDRVRNEIERIAADYPETHFLADSRRRIHLFKNVIVKPNHTEGARALGMGIDQTSPEHMVRHIAAQTGRPACLTLGSRGVLLFDGETTHHVRGFPHDGPVDIVGAGDSMTAGMITALCAGASYAEAVLIGNLAASITVEQIGVTGTASPDSLRARFREYRERFPKVCEKI